MKISNWDKAKKQFRAGIPIFLITVGFIFTIIAFIGLWNGTVDYRIQKEQSDWPSVNATVSYVEEQTRHSMTPGSYGHTFTYYDIYYDYIVDGQTYNNVIKGKNRSRNIGDTFDIKYNPIFPEESTHILEPSKSYIISGASFGLIGLFLMALSIILVKANKS